MTCSLHPALAGVLTLAVVEAASAETRLPRFSDVHGDDDAFCYAGDVWLAPSFGGTASRLTARAAPESSR